MTVNQIGNEDLLNSKSKTAFLCSRRCPDEVVSALDSWIALLDPENDCVVCGGHSGIEKKAVVKLMEHDIPLIWMQSEPYNDRWKPLVDKALENGKLLMIQYEDAETASYAVAIDRNNRIIEMCNHVVVAYRDKGGNVERQTQNLPNVKLLVEQQYLRSSYRIRRDGGDIYLDVERGMSGKYVKISQTRNSKSGTPKKECVFINSGELFQLKRAVEWALEQTKGIRFERQDEGNRQSYNNNDRDNNSRSAESKTVVGDAIEGSFGYDESQPVQAGIAAEGAEDGLYGKLKSAFGFGKKEE